jgi:hypothetical protein
MFAAHVKSDGPRSSCKQVCLSLRRSTTPRTSWTPVRRKHSSTLTPGAGSRAGDVRRVVTCLALSKVVVQAAGQSSHGSPSGKRASNQAIVQGTSTNCYRILTKIYLNVYSICLGCPFGLRTWSSSTDSFMRYTHSSHIPRITHGVHRTCAGCSRTITWRSSALTSR